jgi:methylated-DNA-[protein]-cysteine S-methyltransferase
MKSVYYTVASTAFGAAGVVWMQKDGSPTVMKICFPVEGEGTDNLVRRYFPGAEIRSHSNVEKVCHYLREYLAGDPPEFSLNMLDMRACSQFQRNVLILVWSIPRGMVGTYKGLAGKIRAPKGARAVGMALASNPFPLVIPCHRVIRTDGSLGGYGGGVEMKQNLLEIEGVLVNEKGKVLPRFFW